MELIVFAAFMLIWKGLDIAYNAYQIYLSAKIEMKKPVEVEVTPEEPPKREIGFTSGLIEVEEGEEEE